MTVALTFHEPWGSAVVYGLKGIETRPSPPASWPLTVKVPRRYPGCGILPGEDVLIHTATTDKHLYVPGNPLPGHYYRPSPLTEQIPHISYATHALRGQGNGYRKKPTFYLGGRPWPLGMVIGVAKITEVLPMVPAAAPTVGPAPFNGVHRLFVGDGELWRTNRAGGPALEIRGELEWGDYRPGRWGWRLGDVRRLETPIPARGKQGVWQPDDDLVAAVEAAPKVTVEADAPR